jgi:hypothetical protein
MVMIELSWFFLCFFFSHFGGASTSLSALSGRHVAWPVANQAIDTVAIFLV